MHLSVLFDDVRSSSRDATMKRTSNSLRLPQQNLPPSALGGSMHCRWHNDHVTNKASVSTSGQRSTADQVVLITGGSGFLGQHLVKMLQEQENAVKEIRVFDVKPHVNMLGYKEEKPVKSVVGDIRSRADLQSALNGVDLVFHIAGLVSFGTFPDFNGMEEINVQGTRNLIDACVLENVPRLVYTSTVDVVIGCDEIVDGDESLPIPQQFLFPGYPDTKQRAEALVLSANGQQLSKGGNLRTLSLRPNVMYGECDPYYVTKGLLMAKNNGGVLPCVGNGNALFQQAYVGNVAWAHLQASKALQLSADAGGQAYFVPDDTPLMNSFEFLQPFLASHGYCLSSYKLPYMCVYGALRIAEMFLKMLSPVCQLNLSTTSCSVAYICKTFYFSRKKAEKELDYKPLYDSKQTLEQSMKYYSNVDLNQLAA